MKKLLSASFFMLVICGALGLQTVNGQDPKPWRVWQRDSPCSGRSDWVVVAQGNPGGGMNSCEIFPGSRAYATRAEAQAEADTDRMSSRFSQYCCHDYSVWQNQQTGNFTVVLGKSGNPGPGWFFKKGDLCCEDAYTFAGLPNPANCGAGGGTGSCGMGTQWQEEEAGWTSVWTRNGNTNIFQAVYTGPAGQRATTTNSVTVTGNYVSIRRTASSDNNLCSYTGTIARDGVTVQGTYTCPNGVTRPWKAKINCGSTSPKGPGTDTPEIAVVRALLNKNATACRINKILGLSSTRTSTGWLVTGQIMDTANGKVYTDSISYRVASGSLELGPASDLSAEIKAGCPRESP